METTKNTYYDAFLTKKILKNMYKDPIGSIPKFQNYIEQYPNDYSIMTDYILLLTRMNKIDEASTLLDELEEKYTSDKNIYKYEEKQEIFYKKLLYVKLQLLFYQKKYSKWLNLYKSNNYILDREKELYLCSLYIRKKLGLLDMERPKNRYLVGQIVDYDFNEFKSHIEHHIDSEYVLNEDEFIEEEIKENSIFNQQFPVEQIVDELLKILPNEKAMNGFFENEYIFKYDNNGRSHNKITDFFKVITFANTNDLITMYPTFYGENLPYTDINYLRENQPKIKKISMIDKFNKKYSILDK